MRFALIALSFVLGIGTADAQQRTAPDSGGSATQNSIGRTAIPEKMGKPLHRGLTSSDVKLRNAAPLRLEHRQRPVKSKDLPTR